MVSKPRLGLFGLGGALLLFVVALCCGDDGCGNGYLCTHNQYAEVYGCAIMENEGRISPMLCCSVGEPESGCAKASVNGTSLPYCPANGPTGQGCVRIKQTTSTYEEECGDGYTCSVNDYAYGCVKLPESADSPLVCCSAGFPQSGCDKAGVNGTKLARCPSGGATGEGCVRERKTEVFEEECGPGYTCVATLAYGCAKLPVETNFTMVCCSQGQEEKYCAEASSTGVPLPYCPAGGATGTGCVRETFRDGV